MKVTLVKIVFILSFSMSTFLIQFAYAIDFRSRAYQYADEYGHEDVQVEIEFGKNLAASMLSRMPLVDNDKAQIYINQLGAYVASQVGRPELSYHFAIVNSPDVNAYALPGGFIFVTKEAMKFAKDEDALIGILAHEMAHIHYRHVVRSLGIKSHSFLFGAMSAISGGSTQSFSLMLQELVKKADEILFNKGLQKKEEYDSDKFAFSFLQSQGLSVESYKKIFVRLNQHEKNISILERTHPPIQSRIKLLTLLQKVSANSKDTKELPSANTQRYRDIISSL